MDFLSGSDLGAFGVSGWILSQGFSLMASFPFFIGGSTLLIPDYVIGMVADGASEIFITAWFAPVDLL